MVKLLGVVAVCGSLFAAGCGGGATSDADSAKAPAPEPVTLIADKLAFDKPSLAAAAGSVLSVMLDNKEAVPHNVSVYAEDPDANPNAKALFKGDMVTGPASTKYRIPALAAGSYTFRCDTHPAMKGTFVVS